MLSRSSRFAALLVGAAILATGCIDEGSNVAGPEPDPVANATGLTLLLTDAPGDFLSAVVSISEIYFQSDDGRITLLDEPFTTDLLTLQNAFTTVVQGVDVPPGSYTQLRAVVTGAYIEVETENGSRIFASAPDFPGLPLGAQVDGELHMPSWGASGLKIEMPDGRLDVGEGETIVLIDFNVQESFGKEAGKSGRWVMRPRVTATNVTMGGRVLARLQLGTGVTLPDLAGQPVTLAAFSASLTPAGGGAATQIQLTDGDADGIFEAMFHGLLPGQYTLDFIAPSGLILTFDPTLPRTLDVVSNQTTTETVTVGSAALAGSIAATLTLASGVTLPTIGGSPVTLAQFRAQLTPAGGGAATEIAFTDANNDATFDATFANLPAGDYSLTVLAPAGVTATFDPVPPLAITLVAGATETRPFVITAASAP